MQKKKQRRGSGKPRDSTDTPASLRAQTGSSASLQDQSLLRPEGCPRRSRGSTKGRFSAGIPVSQPASLEGSSDGKSQASFSSTPKHFLQRSPIPPAPFLLGSTGSCSTSCPFPAGRRARSMLALPPGTAEQLLRVSWSLQEKLFSLELERGGGM